MKQPETILITLPGEAPEIYPREKITSTSLLQAIDWITNEPGCCGMTLTNGICIQLTHLSDPQEVIA